LLQIEKPAHSSSHPSNVSSSLFTPCGTTSQEKKAQEEAAMLAAMDKEAKSLFI